MQRLRFANQLRGLAAVSVAVSHLVAVYWAIPAAVTWATFSPPQSGTVPDALSVLFTHPWFNPGPFGVALFFLISGLVIPFSLDKHSRLSFIGARLLRIYPPYLAALLLETAVLGIAAHGWDRPFSWGWPAFWSNALLVYDLVGQPSIDLVNWTLSVELKFYLLVVLIAPALRRASTKAVIAAALALAAVNVLLAGGWGGSVVAVPSTPVHTASSQSLCLIYMLLGTLFHFHLRGRLGTAGLLAALAGLGTLFALTWLRSVWREQFPVVTANYGYGLALFGALYAGRRFVPANRLLDAVAAISFPLYALHSVLGFSVLRALMVGAGWGYYPALAVALAAILLAASLIHLGVERPSIAAGRLLATRSVSRLVYPAQEQTVSRPASKPSRPA